MELTTRSTSPSFVASGAEIHACVGISHALVPKCVVVFGVHSNECLLSISLVFFGLF